MCDEPEQSRVRTDSLIRRINELLAELTVEQRTAGSEVQYVVVGCQPPQSSPIQATDSGDGFGDEGSGTDERDNELNKYADEEDSEPGEMVEDEEDEISIDDIYSEYEDDVEFLPTFPMSTLVTIDEEIEDEEGGVQIISDDLDEADAEALRAIIQRATHMHLNTNQDMLERYTRLRMNVARMVHEHNRYIELQLEETEYVDEEPVPIILDENDNIGGDQEVAIASDSRHTIEDEEDFCAFFVVDLPTLSLQDSGIAGDACAEVITEAGEPCTDIIEVNERTPFVERTGEFQGETVHVFAVADFSGSPTNNTQETTANGSRTPEPIAEVEELLIDFSEFTGIIPHAKFIEESGQIGRGTLSTVAFPVLQSIKVYRNSQDTHEIAMVAGYAGESPEGTVKNCRGELETGRKALVIKKEN
ncbi:hypothetical protein Q9L58_009969 [Maublancomyces gigas]|uniref:Uncharacterized protein n=1 Tax=Discina gigas TaxID=1032678 RepID=A0ABR3G5F8_9PEZI